MDDRPQPSGYVPPPAFAPPALRIAPLNEVAVYGQSSYPQHAQAPRPAQWGGYYSGANYHGAGGFAPGYAPVPWHPALGPHATHPGISRKITVLVAATVVAALIAVVTLLSNAAGNRHASRSLSVPDTAGEYNRVTTIPGSQLQQLGTGSAFGSFPPEDIAKARVGLFSRGAGTPTLVFIGFLADDSPSIGAELRSSEPTTVIDEVFAGAGSSATPVGLDPGPLGGALEASDIDIGGRRATVAVWADDDTLGLVMDFATTQRPSVSEMAVIALAMRTAAEK